MKLVLFQMRFSIWYHLHNLKNMKNIHGGVLFLVKLQDLIIGVQTVKIVVLTYVGWVFENLEKKIHSS